MIEFLIHSPVTYFAAKTPSQAALCFRGHSMSYAELDVASNQLANALIQNGLNKQDRVGIYMYKGLDLGVAIYAILKAGGVFVPLDPFMPAERLAFILADCEISHLVSSDEMVRPLKALNLNKSTLR